MNCLLVKCAFHGGIRVNQLYKTTKEAAAEMTEDGNFDIEKKK